MRHRKMNLWRIEKNFVLLWTIVHGIAWPLGVVSGSWIGWKWLGWLAYHVPGEHLLGHGWYPNHQYIGLFLWSAFLLGGAIVGLWVGIAQWLVLRIWYNITVWWIVVNVLTWSFSGILLRLIILIFGSGSRSTIITLLIPLLLGGFITGVWLQYTLAKSIHERVQIGTAYTINPVSGRLATYVIDSSCYNKWAIT
jgi:hypothetical protein